MNFDNQNKKTGVNRIISAFFNTCKGLLWMTKNEAAFKQELALLILLSAVAVGLDVTPIERVILLCSLLLILLTETINTAIEATVDRISLEMHELSGLAKDLGSAAVFISFCIAIVAWGVILWG